MNDSTKRISKNELNSDTSRRGEKAGWIGGGVGMFLWILTLAAMRFYQGAVLQAALAVLLFTLGLVLLVMLTPWRYPSTPYYKLLLPLFAVFFVGVAWAAWSLSELEPGALRPWHFFWTLPCLLPLFILGRRTWNTPS